MQKVKKPMKRKKHGWSPIVEFLPGKNSIWYMAPMAFTILYALTDEEERRIMYVNISFCNFYCEIAYEDIIPADVLPVGFDAHKDNPSRRKFEVTDDMESAFSGGGPKLLPQDSSNP